MSSATNLIFLFSVGIWDDLACSFLMMLSAKKRKMCAVKKVILSLTLGLAMVACAPKTDTTTTTNTDTTTTASSSTTGADTTAVASDTATTGTDTTTVASETTTTTTDTTTASGVGVEASGTMANDDQANVADEVDMAAGDGIEGKVESWDQTGHTFTMMEGDKSYTVIVNDQTQYMDGENAWTMDDFYGEDRVGQDIAVEGTMDSATNTITATKITRH